MSLASARLLMRGAMTSRSRATYTGCLGLAATHARCAPLHNSLIHARRRFTSTVAASSDLVAAASAAPAAASSSAFSPLVTLQAQLLDCIKAQQPAEAERLIRQFEAQGGRSDVAMLAQWIGSHQKAADWQGAERAWARITELSLQPDNSSYRKLMQVYTRAGGEQLVKISPLLAEMHQCGVQLSVSDYERLIKTAHRCNLPAEVRRWSAAARAAGLFDSLDDASRYIASRPVNRVDSAPSVSTEASSASSSSAAAADLVAAKSQLQIALSAEDPQTAQRVISAFEERGGRPDVMMLTQWISCHKKSGDWQAAERVWARFSELSLKPSNVSYRTLIQVYTQAGGEQLAKIDPLLTQMHQCDVQLAAKDYQSLIKCAHRCNLPAEVGRWSTAARAAGLFDSLDRASRRIAARPVNRVDSAAPVSTDASSASSSSAAAADFVTAKSQLRIALSAKDAQTAQRIISEFEEQGGQLDVMMLSQWIGCHDKAGDWQGAERAWARFGELSLKPDNVSYRTLINVYTRAGGEQLAKIDPLLAEMQAAGLSFNTADYQHLIKTAHRSQQLTELRRWADLARAAGLWDQLEALTRGIIANFTLQSGADGLSALQRWSALNDQQKRDNSLVLSKLLSELATEGQSAEAEGIIADCESIGIALADSAVTAWIGCYRQHGDWAGAERAWARLGELQLKPSNVSYRTLINVYTHAGGAQLSKIAPLLAEMHQCGVQLSVSDYERLIKTAHRCNLPAEVRRWSAAARAAGLFDSLDDASCNIATRPANRLDSAAPSS